MKSIQYLLGALIVLAGAPVVGAEETIGLDDLPPDIRQTINDRVGDGEIREIEKETEAGQEVYEVEFVRDGQEYELVLSMDGRVLEEEAESADDDDEMDDEEESDDEEEEDEAAVEWDKLPSAVKDAFSKLSGGAPVSVSMEKEHGQMVYEGSYKSDGIPHEAEVDGEGHVLEIERPVSREELPARVRAALEKMFPEAEIEEAESLQVFFYEIEIRANGRVREVKILPNGALMDDDDD